jgi:tetratricopeptide (TPR) repeat protein
MDDGGRGSVEAARAAAGARDWARAYELFAHADTAGEMTLPELPVFAEVAYAAGRLDTTIEIWERAHVAFLEAGDRIMAAAAAVRVAMHLLFDTALLAPVRGWLARAESLLEVDAATPAHAWLAVVRNYERMLAGDVEGAREWARRAVDIGEACDPAAAAVGTVARARLHILDGDVTTGLAMLDEAGATVMSGLLDPLSTGVVYCELVCALQGLAQYDRAEEWTEAMERWSRTNAIGSLHGRCRVHRAEILRLRGQCGEAEAEVLDAIEELRPYLRRELGWPMSELGRIRLHAGDLDGAEEALLAADQVGWQAHPGLALVWHARGDTKTALAALRTALEERSYVPSKELPPNTSLWRAPMLAASVTVEIEAGELDRAREAADELAAIADRYESVAHHAGAAMAAGRVHLASGDSIGAEHAFADAVRLWNEVRAPYETAVARLALAEVYEVSARDRLADRERAEARATLAQLVARSAADDGAPVGSFRNDGDYWTIEFAGRTAVVKDLRGMHYLARLLAEPGHEVHVLDLVPSDTTDVRDARVRRFALGDAGPLLDEHAKNAYRRRLAEIEDDLADARRAGDVAREQQADTEREFLLRELSRAVGLGGRDRRASSASERARAAVTRAVRHAIDRIAEQHDALGEHLTETIRTGTYCAYDPGAIRPVRWSL